MPQNGKSRMITMKQFSLASSNCASICLIFISFIIWIRKSVYIDFTGEITTTTICLLQPLNARYFPYCWANKQDVCNIYIPNKVKDFVKYRISQNKNFTILLHSSTSERQILVASKQHHMYSENKWNESSWQNTAINLSTWIKDRCSTIWCQFTTSFIIIP